MIASSVVIHILILSMYDKIDNAKPVWAAGKM